MEDVFLILSRDIRNIAARDQSIDSQFFVFPSNSSQPVARFQPSVVLKERRAFLSNSSATRYTLAVGLAWAGAAGRAAAPLPLR